MLLACSSPMIPGDTLTDKAILLAQWGYDAIAVFHPLQDWNSDVRRELTALTSRTGVRPVEFVLTDAVYGQAMTADDDLRERCRAMYREAAAVCAEIGAVTEIEYEYGPQDPLPLFEPHQPLDDQQRSAFLDFYRELLEIVSGSEGRVLLEPLNRYESRYLNLVDDNLVIIDAVDHPQAGLLPDVFHMSIEESDLPAALRRAGDRIAHVHLGDSNRLLPGHGHLDWPEIFAALREVGYDRYVNLECSTEGDPATTLPATAERLRALIES
ncbi:sugar phosphate isomerase/epimerase family protein [Microlunatus soli]|uniref:Sugar phosphate isomerase/epimerase n=1 Tax=Microlunatus soli TaxID=630515 RepID=A0A1H1XUF5_9ACTN|nr:sugar phosphate isomerase/epimerase family protein [Microlunatus soli]SDT12823.1 Sugar phosphate isomerase/epimerase [Microlunatus soli]